MLKPPATIGQRLPFKTLTLEECFKGYKNIRKYKKLVETITKEKKSIQQRLPFETMGLLKCIELSLTIGK